MARCGIGRDEAVLHGEFARDVNIAVTILEEHANYHKTVNQVCGATKKSKSHTSLNRPNTTRNCSYSIAAVELLEVLLVLGEGTVVGHTLG